MMSFLYVWQTALWLAPLVAASAAIGFCPIPWLLGSIPSDMEQKVVSGALLSSLLLFYCIEKLTPYWVNWRIAVWSGVLLTLGWIIFGGIAHGNFLQPLRDINTGFKLGGNWLSCSHLAMLTCKIYLQLFGLL